MEEPCSGHRLPERQTGRDFGGTFVHQLRGVWNLDDLFWGKDYRGEGRLANLGRKSPAILPSSGQAGVAGLELEISGVRRGRRERGALGLGRG